MTVRSVSELVVESAAQELPLERLEAEICELAGHLAAAECRWMVLLEEFDRREGWSGWGVTSCAHWVAWKCGMSLGAARERVRVARRLPTLPRLREAFGRGELSYAKVRAVTRVATPGREAALLEAARHATTPQLEQIVRAFRPALTEKEELDTANARHDARFLRWHYNEDGSLELRGRLTPEDGAVLLAAIEDARQAAPVPGEDVSMETPPPEMSAADALVTVARAALTTTGDNDAAERCTVMIHVDEAVLAGRTEDGRCHLDEGPAIAPETARRLACDAAVIRVLVGNNGNVLDIGRQSRSIPTALRRALRRRDGGCRFPGCSNRRFVDGHHIQYWSKGGPTKLDNLILLCRRHHRLVHEGRAKVHTPSPGVFLFTRADGQPIPDSPESRRPTGAGLPEQHRSAGVGIDSDTIRSLGENLGFDIGLTVDALLTNKDIQRVELGTYGQGCLAA
ncbi:MAG: hypothetical protein QOE80_801 [Actinomycetota bacterium]|nr:hypothetical protein [Actinomycetota bacterium]